MGKPASCAETEPQRSHRPRRNAGRWAKRTAGRNQSRRTPRDGRSRRDPRKPRSQLHFS